MGNEQQQLEAQIIQLKARLLDSKDSTDRMSEIINLIAQKVGYQGQDIEGLLSALDVITADSKAGEDDV